MILTEESHLLAPQSAVCCFLCKARREPRLVCKLDTQVFRKNLFGKLVSGKHKNLYSVKLKDDLLWKIIIKKKAHVNDVHLINNFFSLKLNYPPTRISLSYNAVAARSSLSPAPSILYILFKQDPRLKFPFASKSCLLPLENPLHPPTLPLSARRDLSGKHDLCIRQVSLFPRVRAPRVSWRLSCRIPNEATNVSLTLSASQRGEGRDWGGASGWREWELGKQ